MIYKKQHIGIGIFYTKERNFSSLGARQEPGKHGDLYHLCDQPCRLIMSHVSVTVNKGFLHKDLLSPCTPAQSQHQSQQSQAVETTNAMSSETSNADHGDARSQHPEVVMTVTVSLPESVTETLLFVLLMF